jgi:PhnB protein
MISYEDGVAALAWLRKAFGFLETARLTTPDGRLSHGEMKAGDGLIRATAAGAMILSEIEEGPPGRRYRAEDLEGHRWSSEVR